MWDTTSIMPLQIRWINQMSKFSGSNCHGPQHYIFSKHLKPWAYLPVHSLCSHSKTQFQKYCWTVAGWLTAGTDFLELMVVWAVHIFLVVSTAVGVAFVMSFCTSAHQHCFMYIQSQIPFNRMSVWTDTHTHTHTQETVSGSGISWAICKSAPCSRQITTPAPHYSVFYRPDGLPATQPTASKHWRQKIK